MQWVCMFMQILDKDDVRELQALLACTCYGETYRRSQARAYYGDIKKSGQRGGEITKYAASTASDQHHTAVSAISARVVLLTPTCAGRRNI